MRDPRADLDFGKRVAGRVAVIGVAHPSGKSSAAFVREVEIPSVCEPT
ncbi:hypothetical protein O3Q52_52015 [Streptomyces sp. ActVer]|nr:hypothetical protein [Streptomyces sp. ActVer]MCZ4516496.1 hypothetical protein [Streptomyces sp. ActVer]